MSFGTRLSARSLAQPLGMCAAAASEQGKDLRSAWVVFTAIARLGKREGAATRPPYSLVFPSWEWCPGIN